MIASHCTTGGHYTGEVKLLPRHYVGMGLLLSSDCSKIHYVYLCIADQHTKNPRWVASHCRDKTSHSLTTLCMRMAPLAHPDESCCTRDIGVGRVGAAPDGRVAGALKPLHINGATATKPLVCVLAKIGFVA